MPADFNIPGWWVETLPSGNKRHRVRQEGNKRKVTTIPVGPDDPAFFEHYWAARTGEKHQPKEKPVAKNTFGWLVNHYLTQLAQDVEAGTRSAYTLKQRKSQLTRLLSFTDTQGTPYRDLHMQMPTEAFVRVRNKMRKTPGEANNTIKSVRAMYATAMAENRVSLNPAVGIAKLEVKGEGAKPWTAEDIRKFREAHPLGTQAHLYLTLLMFTGCRISDAVILGRKHEVKVHGVKWLSWQPAKKNSAYVEIPMLPQLEHAIQAMTVKGDTYLLSAHGRPYASPEALRNKVQEWCKESGIIGKTSHGIRKAMATLLAESGVTEKQIGAVLSHTRTDTTEIYTKSASQRVLSSTAMQAMKGIEW